MDFFLELEQDADQDLSLELGRFQDLEHLIELLNATCEGMEYRLEPMEGHGELFLFVEDPVDADDYECGIVEKVGKKAVAFSPAVHQMVMGAYQRYLDSK